VTKILEMDQQQAGLHRLVREWVDKGWSELGVPLHETGNHWGEGQSA